MGYNTRAGVAAAVAHDTLAVRRHPDCRRNCKKYTTNGATMGGDVEHAVTRLAVRRARKAPSQANVDSGVQPSSHARRVSLAERERDNKTEMARLSSVEI